MRLPFSSPTEPGRSQRLAAAGKVARRCAGAALLVAALVVLWGAFRELSGADLARRIWEWGPQRTAAALALSAASFSLAAILEWRGLRTSGAPTPFLAAARRSFIVNGFTHALGANVAVAAVARAWAYRGRELGLVPAAATTLYISLSFVTGLAGLVAAGLLFASPVALAAVRLRSDTAHLVGLGLLLGIGAYFAVCARYGGTVIWRRVQAPTLGDAAVQLAVGIADNALSAAVLWVLIGDQAPPFGAFVGPYAVAVIAGLVATVPGGAGVLEGTLLVLLPAVPRAALAAGFIGFRLFFYILPLMAAVLLVGLEAAAERPGRGRRPAPPTENECKGPN